MLRRPALFGLFHRFRFTGKIAFGEFRDQRYGLCDAIGVIVFRGPDGLGFPVFCIVHAASARLPFAVMEYGDDSFNRPGRANEFLVRFDLRLRTRAGQTCAEDPDESNPIGKHHEGLSETWIVLAPVLERGCLRRVKGVRRRIAGVAAWRCVVMAVRADGGCNFYRMLDSRGVVNGVVSAASDTATSGRGALGGLRLHAWQLGGCQFEYRPVNHGDRRAGPLSP